MEWNARLRMQPGVFICKEAGETVSREGFSWLKEKIIYITLYRDRKSC